MSVREGQMERVREEGRFDGFGLFKVNRRVETRLKYLSGLTDLVVHEDFLLEEKAF